MSTGKKEVWRLTGPSLLGNEFRTLALEKMKPHSQGAIAEPALEHLPSEFINLYNLDATSTPENNPYHNTAARLARSMAAEDKQSPTQHFLGFLSDVDLSYAALLQQKDSRALLLLAYVCRFSSRLLSYPLLCCLLLAGGF